MLRNDIDNKECLPNFVSMFVNSRRSNQPKQSKCRTFRIFLHSYTYLLVDGCLFTLYMLFVSCGRRIITGAILFIYSVSNRLFILTYLFVRKFLDNYLLGNPLMRRQSRPNFPINKRNLITTNKMKNGNMYCIGQIVRK